MKALRQALTLTTLALGLVGCGNQPSTGPSAFNSAGQVSPTSATPISYYAAARFAEQVSFGPTPELIAEIQAKGYSAWIDEQMLLPVSQIDLTPMLPDLYKGGQDDKSWAWSTAQFPNIAVAAPDQLRARVAWSLAQFIVVSRNKLEPIAILEWQNWLMREAFTDYASLLYSLSVQPGMGSFLDNDQNRPKSDRCNNCAPNENYARELMQLFSIGVYKLNRDGTLLRDSKGQPIETYGQEDVEELARALTGWRQVSKPKMFPDVMNNADSQYWDRPMQPEKWDAAHDYGEKRVLGRTIPANQGAEQDLRSAVQILMDHPNTAPFVSYRLIQHLVKSNPSPAYLERITRVWDNNGKGVRGDLKAVVKAVLLDPEARLGDDPLKARSADGKIREPFLFESAMWRGMGCERWPFQLTGQANLELNQQPFNSQTVFGYYAPTDVASGTNLPAPESKLLDSREFNARFGFSVWMRYAPITRQDEERGVLSMQAAGCDISGLKSAYDKSATEFIDLISKRYFKGIMPAALRVELEQLHAEHKRQTWLMPHQGTQLALHYALTSPYFGAMK